MFWPESAADHADPFSSKPTVTAAILLSAMVWIWSQVNRERDIRLVVSCLENSDESDYSPAELARFCYDDLGDDDYYD